MAKMEPRDLIKKLLGAEEVDDSFKNSLRIFFNHLIEIIDIFRRTLPRLRTMSTGKEAFASTVEEQFKVLRASGKQFEYYFEEYAKLYGLKTEEVKAFDEIELTLEKLILILSTELHTRLNIQKAS